MSTRTTPSKPNSSPALLPFIGFGFVACLLYGIGAGLRADVGILLEPLAEQCRLPYDDVSLCIAVMQLVFGASQPLFGIVASRRSNRFVLLGGCALFLVSLAGMTCARDMLSLMLSLGLLFGLGAGAVGFGLVLTSAINYVGPDRAMAISGMLNAAAGMGSFALSPVLGALALQGGAGLALAATAVPVAVIAPAALLVTSKDRVHHVDQGAADEQHRGVQPEGATDAAGLDPRALFRKATRNRTFLMLVIGFTTCGFHMVLIESHLFSQFVLFGIDPATASWVFSLYGIFTIGGALLSGWLSMRLPLGRLLAFYYGFRALWVAAYLFLVPKTLASAILFAAGLGMTGDATVSPTSGLVNREFRFSEVATLIGVLFFCHQVGAFFSAWVGGILRSATGGYELLWIADIALCAVACLASLAIRNARSAQPQPATSLD